MLPLINVVTSSALNPPDTDRTILAWNVNSRKYEKAHYNREIGKYIGEAGSVIAIDLFFLRILYSIGLFIVKLMNIKLLI